MLMVSLGMSFIVLWEEWLRSPVSWEVVVWMDGDWEIMVGLGIRFDFDNSMENEASQTTVEESAHTQFVDVA